MLLCIIARDGCDVYSCSLEICSGFSGQHDLRKRRIVTLTEKSWRCSRNGAADSELGLLKVNGCETYVSGGREVEKVQLIIRRIF